MPTSLSTRPSKALDIIRETYVHLKPWLAEWKIVGTEETEKAVIMFARLRKFFRETSGDGMARKLVADVMGLNLSEFDDDCRVQKRSAHATSTSPGLPPTMMMAMMMMTMFMMMMRYMT